MVKYKRNNQEIKKKVGISKFNSEEELSSIRFSCADEALGEIKNLFFLDQLAEERILLEIFSPNDEVFKSQNINNLPQYQVFTQSQLLKKGFMTNQKFVDSCKYQGDYSVKTILSIKDGQRRLNCQFKGFYILLSNRRLATLNKEPELYLRITESTYYWIHPAVGTQKKFQRFHLLNFFNWIKIAISTKMSSK